MTKQEHEQIEEIAAQIIDMAYHNANKNDGIDIAEYMAYEIIDLIERNAPYKLYRNIANKTLHLTSLPKGANGMIKGYFNLPY